MNLPLSTEPRTLATIACVALAVGCQSRDLRPAPADGVVAVTLQDLVRAAPALRFQGADLPATPPTAGWQLGMVSWVAGDSGRFYLLHRGDQADPIVVVDTTGRVIRSWGRGLFTMPHAIRLDRDGNVWTADAATSKIFEFTSDGRKLLEIDVGGTPAPCVDQLTAASRERRGTANNFCGTTDLAIAPNGHIFVTDGYANDRVLEYTAAGVKVKEWGSAGAGPGEFKLPHSIRIDEHGIIYVADRENGRVQRFDSTGKYLSEWTNLGRVFSLDLRGHSLWIATQPLELPNGSPGWLLELDRDTGKILAQVPITGGHGMAALENGELIVGPGPDRRPQWFRPVP